LRLQGALNLYFDNMSMSDDARATQDMINELEMKKAMLQYVTEITTMETQIKNNKVQGQQLTMAMAQMTAPVAPAPQPQVTPAVQNGGGMNAAGSQPVPPGPDPMSSQDLPLSAQQNAQEVAMSV
jgi:hypothetical protein